MFPASSKGGGVCMGMPDVCKTPSPAGPVPIPYPNIGNLAQAQKTSTKVKFDGKEAANLNTQMSQSQGDEAGTDGGVVSGSNMQTVAFKKGSMKVKIEGQPAVYLTSTTGHNGSNANMPSGAQIAPSQAKVLVAS